MLPKAASLGVILFCGTDVWHLLGRGMAPAVLAETPQGPTFPAALLELFSTNWCARRGRKLLPEKVLW